MTSYTSYLAHLKSVAGQRADERCEDVVGHETRDGAERLEGSLAHLLIAFSACLQSNGNTALMSFLGWLAALKRFI